MRKIVYSLGVSLDGFMEAPGRDISWHRVDDEVHRHFDEWLAAAGGFLEGRVTYELMAAFWPTADQQPDITEPMRSSPRSGARCPRSSIRARSSVRAGTRRSSGTSSPTRGGR